MAENTNEYNEINIEQIIQEEILNEKEERRRFSLLSIIEFFRDLFFIATGAVVAIFSKDTYKNINSKPKNKHNKENKVAEAKEEQKAVEEVVVSEQKEPIVKESLAEKTENIEFTEEEINKLLNGTIEDRVLLGQKGYALDKLIVDPAWEVKFEVAGKGYGLNVLINDADELVRNKAEHYLQDNNLTLEQWETEYPDKIYSVKKENPSLEEKVAAAEEKKADNIVKERKTRNIDEHENGR